MKPSPLIQQQLRWRVPVSRKRWVCVGSCRRHGWLVVGHHTGVPVWAPSCTGICQMEEQLAAGLPGSDCGKSPKDTRWPEMHLHLCHKYWGCPSPRHSCSIRRDRCDMEWLHSPTVPKGLILQSSCVPRCWASTRLTRLQDGASTACSVP